MMLIFQNGKKCGRPGEGQWGTGGLKNRTHADKWERGRKIDKNLRTPFMDAPSDRKSEERRNKKC